MSCRSDSKLNAAITNIRFGSVRRSHAATPRSQASGALAGIHAPGEASDFMSFSGRDCSESKPIRAITNMRSSAVRRSPSVQVFSAFGAQRSDLVVALASFSAIPAACEGVTR
jgi:hypothetical protein